MNIYELLEPEELKKSKDFPKQRLLEKWIEIKDCSIEFNKENSHIEFLFDHIHISLTMEEFVDLIKRIDMF